MIDLMKLTPGSIAYYLRADFPAAVGACWGGRNKVFMNKKKLSGKIIADHLDRLEEPWHQHRLYRFFAILTVCFIFPSAFLFITLCAQNLQTIFFGCPVSISMFPLLEKAQKYIYSALALCYIVQIGLYCQKIEVRNKRCSGPSLARHLSYSLLGFGAPQPSAFVANASQRQFAQLSTV